MTRPGSNVDVGTESTRFRGFLCGEVTKVSCGTGTVSLRATGFPISLIPPQSTILVAGSSGPPTPSCLCPDYQTSNAYVYPWADRERQYDGSAFLSQQPDLASSQQALSLSEPTHLCPLPLSHSSRAPPKRRTHSVAPPLPADRAGRHCSHSLQL